MNGAQDTIDTLQARLTQLEAGSQRSAKIQAALYAIADAASASTDLPAFYAALHATIGQLMYARNFFIATLDRESGMISWPYYVDEHDTPPAPMRHAGDERTVSAYVMRSGKTFHHRTDEAGRLLQRGEVRVVGTDNTDGVFVPLKDGNAAIGALAVQSYTPGIEYTEEDVRLLTFVAQHIATALTRARALEDTRQRNAELAIINSVQAGLAQELSLQAIYDLVGDRLLEIFQVHTVNIVSYDSSVGDLTDRYAYEKGDRTLVGGSIRLFGFRKHVVETRQSMVINRDILDLARQYGNPTLLGAAPKSAVFVPMLAGDRVTGVVSLQDMDRENAFSPADVSLLETLTAAMSVALENARLYDETQRLLQQSQQRAAELQIINSVQQGLASKLDMQAIYDLVGERLLSIFGVTEVEICEYDPTTRMLRFPYWSSREGRIRQDPLPLGTGLNSYIVETRKPLLLGTAQEILNSGAIMPPGVAVRKSLAGVPILSGERVLGAVSLHDEGREHAFGEAELNLLSALANSLGATLENARLYDETQRLLQQSDQRAAELQIINSVQQGLASKLDMQAIYELVGEKIREIFGADTAYIAVLDEAAQVFDFPFYVDAGKPVETTPLPLGDGLTSKVLAAREPLLLNSAEDVKQHGADQVMRLVPSDPGGEDLNRSYLGVPVWQGARVSAVVSIQSHRPHAFGENETRFLSTLANSMGVALENARLFDQLQARNREISEALEQQTANSEILRVIAGSPTDIQPVLDAVAQNAARLCNSYDAGIARVEGDRIRVVAHWGPVPVPPDQIDPGLPLTAETVTGRAILEARSIHVEDVRSAEGEPYPLSRESSQVTGQRTLLTTPLLREGRAIGAIVLRRQQIDPFTEKQAALLRVFADQAAIAIENVRLFGETKRLLSEAEQRAAELAIINSVQAGLASKLEMQSIYDLVGDKLRETFSEAQVVDILTYDSATGMLHPRYVLEKGRRFEVQPWPAAGFRKHVIETGDPLLINRDAARLSVVHGNPVVVGEPAKSLLFVPMKTGTQVSGVISLQHVDREDAFDAADLRLLQTLAGSMSVALENARLFDETQRLLQETEQRAAELAIINSVQQGLASKLDLQSIYELVCEQIRETFGAETAYIAILDPERKEFRVPYYVDQGEHLPSRRLVVRDAAIPLGQGLTSKVYETGQPLLLRTREEQEGALHYQYSDASQDLNESYLGVPIVAGGAVTGVLSVQSHRQSAYGAPHAQLLSTLAGSMSAALENARLFDETQRLLKETEQRAAELAVINSVQAGMASKTDMQGIYELVGEKIREIFDAQSVLLISFDASGTSRTDRYIYEKGQRIQGGEHQEPLSGLNRVLIRERKTLVFNENAAQETEKLGAAVVPGTQPPRSAVFVPLLAGDRVFGTISLQNVDRENAFGESDLRLLNTLAGSMSVALENARLFDEVQRRSKEISEALERQTATSEILRIIAQSPADLQPVLDAVAETAARLCDTYDAQIVRREGDQLRVAGHWGPTDIPDRLTSGFPLDRNSVTGGAILEQRVIHVEDVRALPDSEYPMSQDLSRSMGQRTLLAIPLIEAGEAIGAIIAPRLEVRPFSEQQIALLRTFADQAVIAIRNARLFEQVQRRTEEISEALEQQTATSDILRVMAEWPADVQPVLEVIADHAAKLCDGLFTAVYRTDGQQVFEAAARDFTDEGLKLHASEYPRPLKMDSSLSSRAILTGQSIHIPDFESAPEVPDVARRYSAALGMRSVYFEPMMKEGKAIGAIGVGRRSAGPFSAKHIELLRTFAHQAVIAIENVRLFNESARLLKETEERAAELAAVNTVSQALVAETDLDRTISLIGDQMRATFAADIVYVALVDPQTNLIVFPYQHGQELSPMRLGEGLTGKIIESGQPILINQELDHRIGELGKQRMGREARSYLGVPITAGGEPIGVISVQSTQQENAFTEDDARLLSTIAANAGAAIRAARLHAETRRRAQEMATLAEIGNEIAATRELEPVLERIAAHAKEIMRVRDIAILLRDPDGEAFHNKVALGRYSEEMKALVVRPGIGLGGSILAGGVAELINDPEHDPRRITVPGTPDFEEDPECLMGAPLVSRGEVIGAIMVWRLRRDGLFTQNELDFLVSVGRQTTIAIESARLYLETRRRANEMSALAEVGREISASLDSAVVLERIAERARGLLQAENSAVYLPELNGTSMKAIAAFGEAAPAVKAITVTLGAGIIGTLAQQGEAAVINDVAHDPRGIAVAGMNEPETERMMVAPLTRGEQVTGMLVVWRTTATFTEADLSFLVGLARQASIALENARLFAEVRAEKQYSETLVRNVPAAIIGIDQDTHVSAWNPAAEKLFGYSLQEALGNPIDDLIATHPEIRDEAIQYSDEARSGKEFRTITRRSRKDGTLVDVELSAVPIRHGDDYLEHIGIFHDITELQQARREAVAANEAKSAFLATMSHEIRTPMNAVIGMSGLLMDTPLSAEQRDYAETIRSSGDALLAIINDILDFSKIEAGRMELERQPFDLRECVESAVDLVAGRANEKGLDLAYLIEDDVPPGIRGDVTRLRQILLNLVSNAVKFTEKGEVVVHVRRDPHPDRLLFTVRDTGIGIPRNRMGRLFESFSQADSSTTRKFGGTGLGLAISKRLAEMMGGAMWAESGGAGKGSTFSFTLQAPQAGVAPRKAARDLQVLQPSLARKRVLIVDDNDTNRRILMRQTEKWGMSPREFGTPRDALRWLKTGQPVDLAIFDLQMPEMDGLTLVREVRKLKRRAQLPIILLTSLGRKEPGAEELGVAAYLMKPLKPSGLFDALAAIFAKGRIAARAETRQATFDASLAVAHPLRILLAEDNAVNQKLALRLLEQMGYRADVASNGIEAVESVQRQAYDVVLMDVQMPEMDGLDATRRIRKLPHLVQPRIVAMTANAMEGDREMCLQAGMDDYVSKPIRVGELQDALRRTPSAQAAVPGKRAPRSRKGGGRPAAKSAPKRSPTTKKVATRRKSPRGRKAR